MMPGHKPGFARRRMAPTRQEAHALAPWPQGQIPLAGGTVRRTREVREVPLVPAVVTEHRYLERRCPGGSQRWVPAVDLTGGVGGQRGWGSGWGA